MIPEGFAGFADTWEVFFRYCRMYKVNTEPERVALIRRMVAKRKAVYIRDARPLIKSIVKGEINVKRIV